MSKYQDIMNKIEVTDKMKSRILQNIEKEMSESAEAAKHEEAGRDGSKIRRFDFKKYMPMAAALAVFVLSTYLIFNVIPHKQAATSTAPMSDSAVMYEATETESATEAAVEEAAEAEMATESAVEAPMAEGEAMEEAMPATEAAEEDMQEVMPGKDADLMTGEGKTSDKTGLTMNAPTDNATLTGGAKTESGTAGGAKAETATLTETEEAAPAYEDGVTESEVQAPVNESTQTEAVTPVADSKPGFFERIARFFKRILETIKGWFK